jgi:hypothetical protein
VRWSQFAYENTWDDQMTDFESYSAGRSSLILRLTDQLSKKQLRWFPKRVDRESMIYKEAAMANHRRDHRHFREGGGLRSRCLLAVQTAGSRRRAKNVGLVRRRSSCAKDFVAMLEGARGEEPREIGGRAIDAPVPRGPADRDCSSGSADRPRAGRDIAPPVHIRPRNSGRGRSSCRSVPERGNAHTRTAGWRFHRRRPSRT